MRVYTCFIISSDKIFRRLETQQDVDGPTLVPRRLLYFFSRPPSESAVSRRPRGPVWRTRVMRYKPYVFATAAGSYIFPFNVYIHVHLPFLSCARVHRAEHVHSYTCTRSSDGFIDARLTCVPHHLYSDDVGIIMRTEIIAPSYDDDPGELNRQISSPCLTARVR